MKKRKMPWLVNLMGGILSLSGSLWPALTSYFAYRVWISSPRYKESRREKVWRNAASTDTLLIAGKKIVIYQWGELTEDYVLLIHGWSGRASQLGAFVDPVNRQGRAVISFDAPGHGESQGDETTIFEIADVVDHIVKQYGTPSTIIAHSFGCMVAAFAIREYSIPVKKLITISCPTDTGYLIAGFAIHFRLSEKVMEQFNNRLIQRFGKDMYVKTSADKNLAGLPVKLLAVHDKNDQIVKWQQSEKLTSAVTGAQTYFTHDLGHQSLLRDEGVINRVMRFIFN